jgi:hypothetical protein
LPKIVLERTALRDQLDAQDPSDQRASGRGEQSIARDEDAGEAAFGQVTVGKLEQHFERPDDGEGFVVADAVVRLVAQAEIAGIDRQRADRDLHGRVRYDR